MSFPAPSPTKETSGVAFSVTSRRSLDCERPTTGSDEGNSSRDFEMNRLAVHHFRHGAPTISRELQYPQPPNQKPGIGFPLARIAVLLSLATGACHDFAIAPYQGKGTGETNLFRRMYDTLQPGVVVLADALFDDYFLACELCQRKIDIVAHAQYERVGSRTAAGRPPGDEILVWQRPNKPHGMTGEQYRTYPKQLVMRQVTVDARDKNNRVKQFKVVTTILDNSIDGKQIGDLYERRWNGEVDIRSIKSTMQMDILRCKTPEMVHKEIWTHLLAYNLLRTVMAIAAQENEIEPRQVSFKGAKQALTAFAPKIEAAQPENRAALIDVMLTTIVYHRVGDRPGRWEPRARKRRPKPAARLTQPRHIAKLSRNRSKWSWRRMTTVRGSYYFLCFSPVDSVALVHRRIISQLCCGPSCVKAALHEHQHDDVQRSVCRRSGTRTTSISPMLKLVPFVSGTDADSRTGNAKPVTDAGNDQITGRLSRWSIRAELRCRSLETMSTNVGLFRDQPCAVWTYWRLDTAFPGGNCQSRQRPHGQLLNQCQHRPNQASSWRHICASSPTNR